MVYVDTSVLVAMCAQEAKTADVLKWYSECTKELVSAVWCVTEFASAMGLKQRTGQLTAEQAQTAWTMFERMCANDLQLLPIEAATYHKAAMMTMNTASGLRAGDALHLACAIEAKCKSMATLDVVLAKNAKLFKVKHVDI
jgi:predicted nucleic acid-binding protein